MNKLVIIGNGFDLAHGLKTSYKDFILWCLKKAFIDRRSDEKPNSLISIKVKKGSIEHNFIGDKDFEKLESIKEFIDYCDHRYLEVKPKFDFIKKIFNDSIERWVDIETEYYNQLRGIYKSYEETKNYDIQEIEILNKCLDIIRSKLEDYLNELDYNNIEQYEFRKIFFEYFRNELNYKSTYIVDFNYTPTLNKYHSWFTNIEVENINNIHGEIKNTDNPIIFGYGDETDKHYEKIEDLNENEFTRHFKSFSYLTTDNYQKLFKFLDKGEFNVYILGHSCGISDRILFKNIFNHANFENGKIQIYYYEYEKDGVIENDFFQKTQELSRHFDINSKHKMRTKVVSFNESKPLPQFKPQN